jgi:hypothetical protein
LRTDFRVTLPVSLGRFEHSFVDRAEPDGPAPASQPGSREMRSTLLLLTALCLPACGGADPAAAGAGSGSPGSASGGPSNPLGGPGNKLRATVQLLDLEVEEGVAEAALELDFRTLEEPPTLLQFDVVTDPARVRLRADVTRIAALPTLKAGLIAPGRLRIVLGDALSPTPTGRLESGALASIPFELLPGPPGSIPVWVEDIVSSDPTGEQEGGPEVFAGPTATISVF